jgi:hypothetical protein
VLEHLGVQEILIDRGQLVRQHVVQVLYNLGIAFHGASPSKDGVRLPEGAVARATASTSNALAHDTQLPQPRPTPNPLARSCAVRAPLFRCLDDLAFGDRVAEADVHDGREVRWDLSCVKTRRIETPGHRSNCQTQMQIIPIYIHRGRR